MLSRADIFDHKHSNHNNHEKLILRAIALAAMPSISFCLEVAVPDASGNLNDASFWSAGAPSVGDVVIWDGSLTGNRTVTIDADPLNFATVNFTTAGLRFMTTLDVASAGTQTINGSGTLELGANGVIISALGTPAAPFIANINTPIRLTANQRWDSSGVGILSTVNNNFNINGDMDANGNAISFTGTGGTVTFNSSYNFDGFTHSRWGDAVSADWKTLNGGVVRFSNLGSFGTGDIVLVGHRSVFRGSGGIEFFGGGEFVIENDLRISDFGKFLISQDSSLTFNGNIYYDSATSQATIGLFASGTNKLDGSDNVLTLNGDIVINNANPETRGTCFFIASDGRAVFNGSILEASAAPLPLPVTFEIAGGTTKARVELRAPNYHTGGTTVNGYISLAAARADVFGSEKVIFSGPGFMEAIDQDLTFHNDILFASTGSSGTRTTTFAGTNNITFTGAAGLNGTAMSVIETAMEPDKSATFTGDFTFSDMANSATQALYFSSAPGLPSAGFIRMTGDMKDGATGAGRIAASHNSKPYFELSGNNTFSGGVTLESGSFANVRFGSENAIGTGPFSFGNGTSTISASGAKGIVLHNLMRAEASGSTLSITGSNNLEFARGFENINNSGRTFNNSIIAGRKFTLSGGDFVMSQNGATANIEFTFNGGGTTIINCDMISRSTSNDVVIVRGDGSVLTLNGANRYRGDTRVLVGATLKGSGSINGAGVIESGGTLNPQKFTFNGGLRFNVNGAKTAEFGYDDLAIIANGSALTWADNSGRAVTINIVGDWKFAPNASMLLFDLSDGTIANAAHLSFTNFTKDGEEITKPLSLQYDDGVISGKTPGVYVVGGFAYIPREPTQIIVR